MQTLFDRAELARLHAQVVGQPVDLAALVKAADKAIAEERFDDAETVMRGAIIAAPERADFWHRLGLIAEGFGETDEATEAYRRSMELAEDDTVALDLARHLASCGEFDEASSLANYLALQADSISIQRAAAALAASIEQREARHAAR
ncbi:MAG: hypothetical protein AAFN74_09190 [Myxococcota bacterium]